QFDKERLDSFEIVDNDEDVVHPFKHHVPPSSSGFAERTAWKNDESFVSSRLPTVRTPVHTSTPKGLICSIASRTFSGFNPPARKIGTGTVSRIRTLIDQLWTRPVPPNSFTAALGLPESRRIASTSGAMAFACSTLSGPST